MPEGLGSGEFGADCDPELGRRVGALVDVVRELTRPKPGNTIDDLGGEIPWSPLSDHDVVGALIAIGPVIGAARLVSAAHTVALLIGYDVDEDLERPPD